MYEWLSDALQDSSEVVTANRRLARVLADEYGQQQLAAGTKAWKTPAIYSWQDWLVRLSDASRDRQALPARLNSNQARVLWEGCLAANLGSTQPNTGVIAKQAQEAWSRLRSFCVAPAELEDSVRSRDQRVFANAASDYAAILERRNWIDAAGLPSLVAQLLRDSNAAVARQVVFAGFDRITPAEELMRSALEDAGCTVREAEAIATPGARVLAKYDTVENEVRAAGAWARQQLEGHPQRRLGIVAIGLDQDAERYARLVREGLAPGWQLNGDDYAAAVNVSYGRRLNSFPAISIALTALTWLERDIDSYELSLLLRSGCIGNGEIGHRAAMEMRIRQRPFMNWSMQAVSRQLRGSPEQADDFLKRLQVLSERRATADLRQSAARWAVIFDEALDALNWPGAAPLASAEFQLVNRWRELLNELARLEVVVPNMTVGEALGRLRSLAAETIFQPETVAGGVPLLGPLEAAGMEFDALWISGLSAANWPPQGNPSVLLSRQLQRSFEMPDFEPSDTLAYASRVLRRLVASAGDIVFSYPQMDGDAEQSASGLLREFTDQSDATPADPEWYAKSVAGSVSAQEVAADPVPSVSRNETVSGGTSTIQLQCVDPLSAFAYGRLGIRPLARISYGIPASLRGTVIHAALADFYREIRSSKELQTLSPEEIVERSETAAARAVARHEPGSDSVVRRLLQLERKRTATLVRAVAGIDCARQPFDIRGVEVAVTLVAGDIEMALRVDRIDHDATGLIVLDYKTGRHRKFLSRDGEPDDIQLVAYACAMDEPVGGLAFVNVDARHVDISGAGIELTPDLDWDNSMGRWRSDVLAAIEEIQRGDVRLNTDLPVDERRRFGLLSRIEEFRRD